TEPADRRGLPSPDLVSTRRGHGGGSTGPRLQETVPHGGQSPAPLAYTYQRVPRVGHGMLGSAVFGDHLEIHGLNNAGQAVIVSEDPDGETMFLVAPQEVKRIVLPGRQAPEGTRYGTVIYMPEAMNNRGQVVWSGTVESGETWN